jgi:hypothetical protein
MLPYNSVSSVYFFDWLHIEQDFKMQLPIISDTAMQRIDVVSGEGSEYLYQYPIHHRGSFCDSLKIHVRGSVIAISGNPSRWARLDNLFGLETIEACIAVYNGILRELGLPEFTKCTSLGFTQETKNNKSILIADGAVIREIHITTNKFVGQGNTRDYISGLSTLNYRNSQPRLHTNGYSVDWLSKQGNANLIYPTVYDKANEMRLHSLTKIKNKFGEESKEFEYLMNVVKYCEENGVVRFEQKLHNRFLQRENLQFWGLADFFILNGLQDQYINLDSRLSVTAMDLENIAEQLISHGVVDTVRAANTTAMYAIQWSNGKVFDFSKRQVQDHRARLRKIGIDIAHQCNISKFSPVRVVATREIHPVVMTMNSLPDWYQRPNHLRVA